MNPIYQYAGLQNMHQPGLSVAECAERLHHLAYTSERLMFLQAAHIISVPERDVKVLLSRLQHEAAEQAEQLRNRLPELRLAKKKAYQPPSDMLLKLVFDEAQHAANTAELLASLALVFTPALVEAYQDYLRQTNGLADYPSVRLVKSILVEVEEALHLLQAAYQTVMDTPEQQGQAETWAHKLQSMLQIAGDVDGTGEKQPAQLHLERGLTAYKISRILTRDETFPRVWDFVHVENEQISERLAQMISTRLSEVTVAEGLVLVLCETEGQPWPFYRDIARHLWDEMRHSLFGEAATEQIFHDRSAMPIRDFEADYFFKMTPLELYAMLGIGVETALMKYPPGKREEYEFCRDSAHHELMTTFQDFDWADEVYHVQIAKRQLKDWFEGSQAELLALAQEGLDFRANTRHKYPQEPLPDIGAKLQGGKVAK